MASNGARSPIQDDGNSIRGEVAFIHGISGVSSRRSGSSKGGAVEVMSALVKRTRYIFMDTPGVKGVNPFMLYVVSAARSSSGFGGTTIDKIGGLWESDVSVRSCITSRITLLFPYIWLG